MTTVQVKGGTDVLASNSCIRPWSGSSTSSAAMSMSSTVPRFPEERGYERVLGPDTYDPRNPCAPLVQVKDRSRKTANFRSICEQRPSIISENTEAFIAPGTYEPVYRAIYPDVSRLEQFSSKKSAIFASQEIRFGEGAGIDVPDSRWSLDVDSVEWTCNRNGGGCWGKAPRESGTLAQYSRKLLQAQAMTAGLGGEEGVAVPAARPASPKAMRPLDVPLDFCFKELSDCLALQKEEPLASYSGALPRRIKLQVKLEYKLEVS